MAYIPLHVHSDNSILDGLSKVKEIAKRASDINVEACAITDHGNISGAVQFISACKDNNIKPIIGVEAYICNDDPKIKDKNNKSLSHLVLLAKNINGFRNLLKIINLANDPEHFYYKPRLSLESLTEVDVNDLICIDGHLGSHLSTFLFGENNSINIDAAIQSVNYKKDIFGSENYFLESQLIDVENLPITKQLTSIVREIGKKTNTKIVATPDAHYTTKESAIDQRVLLCINMNKPIIDINRKIVNGDNNIPLSQFFKSFNYHIPTEIEMKEVGHTEEELANSVLIANMCEIYDLKNKPIIPHFECPNNLTSSEYLKQVCRKGWVNKRDKIEKVLSKLNIDKNVYGDRFREEFNTLEEANLHDYFLVIYDIVQFAHNNNIYSGAGRGSVGGSLIAYLMDITKVDPIEHGLIFGRFYNKGRNTEDRVSLPDIDLDFEMSGRETIIGYLKEKYGHDNVAQMITFNKMQGRAAIKDVLRVWEACPFNVMNEITEFIPNEAEIADQLQAMKDENDDDSASIIKWALINHKGDLKEWAVLNDDDTISGPLGKRFEQAIRLEGTKRSHGKHAAGVVAGNEPLYNICPMIYDTVTKQKICGWEMNDLEYVGLTKFDILGLALLDKIHEITNLLKG